MNFDAWLGTGAGIFFGSVAMQWYNSLPSAATVARNVMPKPHAVYISQDGPIYNKLETYLIRKNRTSIRTCELAPRNGEISYSLNRLKLKTPFIDTYNEHKIEILLQETSIEPTGMPLRTAFGNFALFGERRSDQAAEKEFYIIVSSWTADIETLHAYVTKVCEFKINAQITRMFCAVPSESSSGNGGSGKRQRGANFSTALRWEEVHVKTNKRCDNTIVSQSVLKDVFEDAQTFLNTEEWYNQKGMPYNRGYLLHGPPGTGKTSIIKAFAAQHQLCIFTVDLAMVTRNDQFSSLMKQINYLCKNEPYVLALEDIDRSDMFSRFRHSDGLSMQCLLNEIDGLLESHGRVLFMTANDMEPLKQVNQNALLRPGRIDKVVEVGYCDLDQIVRTMNHFYGDAITPELSSVMVAKNRKQNELAPADLINLIQANIQRPPDVVVDHLFENQLEIDENAPAIVVPTSVADVYSRDKQLTQIRQRLLATKRDVFKHRADLRAYEKALNVRNDEKHWAAIQKKVDASKAKLEKAVERRKKLQKSEKERTLTIRKLTLPAEKQRKRKSKKAQKTQQSSDEEMQEDDCDDDFEQKTAEKENTDCDGDDKSESNEENVLGAQELLDVVQRRSKRLKNK